MYSYDTRAEAPRPIIDLIRDDSFWQKLKALDDIIEPMHEMQLMSESNKSTLDQVYTRWIKLDAHLQSESSASPFADDLRGYLQRQKSGWGERMRKQLFPIHILANILQPSNRPNWQSMPGQLKTQVTDLLDQYGGESLQIEFFDYVDQSSAFSAANNCWAKTSTHLFWKLMVHKRL
jgi:hypothetical protein